MLTGEGPLPGLLRFARNDGGVRVGSRGSWQSCHCEPAATQLPLAKQSSALREWIMEN
ncbi:MAG: hypothetical protein LBT00_10865 [Spirochaetaceae bacterium]|nr:hypothetical protein [Spirochaetaceae bacterium]